MQGLRRRLRRRLMLIKEPGNICQQTDINWSGNSNLREYLERSNFLYWYERFPEEVKLCADHEIFKRLREKYKAETASIDTVARIYSGLESVYGHANR